ncbi:hypothetical protein [Microcoleus vaginatus]|uniref:hypothetical protein n=1 Tax=Microcoleus vaginatus TaxID=119532 RepID=UPI001F61E7B9
MLGRGKYDREHLGLAFTVGVRSSGSLYLETLRLGTIAPKKRFLLSVEMLPVRSNF